MCTCGRVGGGVSGRASSYTNKLTPIIDLSLLSFSDNSTCSLSLSSHLNELLVSEHGQQWHALEDPDAHLLRQRLRDLVHAPENEHEVVAAQHEARHGACLDSTERGKRGRREANEWTDITNNS